MVFSSTVFLCLFLPLVLGVYYVLKLGYRNIFLLLASLLFYAWGEPKFIFIMMLSIFINYFSGLLIEYTHNGWKKFIFAIGILANCFILFYFKYFNFFADSLNHLGFVNIELRNIILPIGISFFTFQGMSYIIDLYMGKVEVQKNFINLALYIALFPQLVAGPIVRYKDINDQINNRQCNEGKFVIGIQRFIIGLSKKMIIANQVGMVVDSIFNLPYYQNAFFTTWLGVICYTLQVYFDFSGYSDMAIGLGKMFGFDFLENFNYPYISKSITEFWRRWHISLSSWFKDYIYIPLGGNRTGNVYFNLLIVFLVTGIWHGAAWNFIIWGLWHGLFLIIERIVKKNNINIKIPNIIKHIYTMLIVVIGWVFFRADTIEYAMGYLRIMFGLQQPYDVGFSIGYYLNKLVIVTIIIGVVSSLPIVKLIGNKMTEVFKHKLTIQVLKNVYMYILFLISIMLIVTSTYNPFIYFRF